MKVRDAMATTVSTATPNDTLDQVARMMKQEDAGFIPITEQDQRLIGVVTDRDIVIRCIAEGHNPIGEPVEHAMTKETVTISADEDIEKAAELMGRAEIRRLAVVEGDKLVGVLSHGNLVQATGGQGPATQATEGVTRGA